MGGSRWAGVKPHHVWGSDSLMSSCRQPRGVGAGDGLGLGLGLERGESSWPPQGFEWGSRQGLLGMPEHRVCPQGAPRLSNWHEQGEPWSLVVGTCSGLPDRAAAEKTGLV